MSLTTYSGGCHCGDVRYTVSLDLKEAVSCNCSICSKAGWLLAFTSEDAFELETDKDALSDYQFGKKHIHHYFCKRCGVRSFGNGTMDNGDTLVSINLRCLQDLDVGALPTTEYDGASL